MVDNYSRYAWVFFLESKDETFGFVRDLILRLRKEHHGDAIRAIRSDNGTEFEMIILMPFVMIRALSISTLDLMFPLRMV